MTLASKNHAEPVGGGSWSIGDGVFDIVDAHAFFGTSFTVGCPEPSFNEGAG